MSSILYLVKKQLKNSFLEMLHHPSKLILYIVVIAFLAVSIIGTAMDPPKLKEFKDIRILQGSYLAILLFMGVLTLLNGVKSGTTFFKMSDVNLLFVSPLSPKKILAYGLVKQAGSSLLGMVFFVFYGAMLINNFQITWADVILLIVGLAVVIFVMQIVSLLIYSFSNGRPRRILGVKATIYGLIILLLCYVGVNILSLGSNLEALYKSVTLPYLEWFPIIGWIKGAVFGIIQGNMTNVLVYTAITAVATLAAILLFVNSDTDYYEDVLQSTEKTDGLRRAMKDGDRATVAALSAKQTKVRDTGINAGWGASAFFYKHLREASRRSRLVFVNGATVLLVFISLAMVFFIGKISSGDKDPATSGQLMAIALGMTVYIQFFINTTGDWARELMKPSIYLVPENPFKKLIWASLTSIMKPVVDGFIIFTILCVALRANPLTALVCALIYGSMGFLFTANSILSQRLFGSSGSKGLLMFAYMFIIALTAAPGVVVSSLLIAFGHGLPGIIVGLPVVVWNIGISFVICAACRNILHTTEMNY